jgi:hypothetical protein
MPQGVIKSSKSSAPSTRRKSAPKVQKKSGSATEKQDHKVSAAISRRIESLMAGRLIHEGGKLSIIPKPSNVDSFVSSGLRMDKKSVADLVKSTIARRVRQSREEGKEKLKDKAKDFSSSTSSSSSKSGSSYGTISKSKNANKKRKFMSGMKEEYNELGIKIADGKEEDWNGSEFSEEEDGTSKKQKQQEEEESDEEENAENEGVIGSWFQK